MAGLEDLCALVTMIKTDLVFRYAESFWPVAVFQLPFCIRTLALPVPLALCVTSFLLPQIPLTVEIQACKFSSYTPRGTLLSYFLPDKLHYAQSPYV